MRGIGIVFVIFLFALSGFALQAIDAESVAAQGNFLESSERAVVYKTLPQTNGTLKYWSVSLLQNDMVRTIIPIADKDSVLVPKGVLRTNLISTNYLVQRLSALKSSIPWFVSLTTSNSLEELANAVDNEQFDVDIVSETISDVSLKSKIAALKGYLATISSELREASNEVKDLSAQETTLFNVSIDTTQTLALPRAYADLFERIDTIKNSAAEYDNHVSSVKNDIATLNELDAQQKSQLLGLLSPLGQNQTLSSAMSTYANTSADNAQRISTEYASLPTKTSALEAELELRLVRASAFASLYGEDKALKSSTTFSTLEVAAETILDATNAPLFVNQSDVSKLQGAWESAENAFSKRQYATAKELGDKAKALVKQIMNDGLKNDETSGAEQNLITGVALVLGGVAAILIIRKAWELMKPVKVDEE
jgi:hypothetical protein